MVFNVFFYVLMTLFIIVSLFLILLVLIQKGRGGGLASAFGGGGGNTAFGSKTGDVLTWATSVVFGVFLFLAIVLNLMANTHHTPATATAGPGAGAPIQSPTESSPATPSQDNPTGLPGVPASSDPGTPTPLGANPSVPAPTTQPLK